MQDNPAGVPWWAVGLAVAAGGGWVFARLKARKKLTELLTASPLVMTALEGGFIYWLPADKAADTITLTNTIGPEQAFASILSEVRSVMPPEAELQLGGDVQRAIEEKLEDLGLDPQQIADAKAEAASLAQSAYASLPDVPLIDTSSWLPSWVTGSGGS